MHRTTGDDLSEQPIWLVDTAGADAIPADGCVGGASAPRAAAGPSREAPRRVDGAFRRDEIQRSCGERTANPRAGPTVGFSR